MGEQIPSDPAQIAKAFGRGWWKPDPQAARELLERAGFSKRGDQWHTPEGKPFAIRILVEGESRPVMTRAGSMIAQQWRQFGIDATTGALLWKTQVNPDLRGTMTGSPIQCSTFRPATRSTTSGHSMTRRPSRRTVTMARAGPPRAPAAGR